jgi:hypothetical protein
MGILPTVVCCTCSIVGLLIYSTALQFLYAHSEVQALTVAQYSMAVLYGVVFAMWFAAEAGFAVARMQPRYDSVAEDEQDLVSSEDQKEGDGSSKTADCKILFFKATHLPILRLCAEFVGIMVSKAPLITATATTTARLRLSTLPLARARASPHPARRAQKQQLTLATSWRARRASSICATARRS